MADDTTGSSDSPKFIKATRDFFNSPPSGRSIGDTLKTGAERLGSIASKAALQGPKAAIDESRKPIPDTPKRFTTSDGREPVLGSFRKGGTIPKTGAYRLHKGERIVPTRSGGKR